MAIAQLIAALKKAIDIRTYAQSTGGNYLKNPIARICARWEDHSPSTPPFIRIDTTGNSGIQRSRAVEGNYTFDAIDLLFDLKEALIEDLVANLCKEARIVINPATDGFELEYARRRLKNLCDRADKLPRKHTTK